jgi:hypothetical protein
MLKEVEISIAGLGIIIYSPFAVEHIAKGEDYLTRRFWQPSDVATHVNSCTLTAFATGTAGDFRLVLYNESLDENAFAKAEFKVELGLEVRGGEVCLRDLYELMDWVKECPEDQKIKVEDGYHLLKVYSSRPVSGVLGDKQKVWLHFRKVVAKPELHFKGVPHLIGDA